MKKKILFLISLMLFVFATNSIYATGANVVKCTDADFNSGAHGCKNKYDYEYRPGHYVDATCFVSDYETGAHGCKDTYETYTTAPDQPWWTDANMFWNGEQSDVAKDAMKTLEPLMDLVKIVGNMIFVAVTVILGVKYIWGGVEAKSDVKGSLVTLVVAALVFYGWNTISALIVEPNLHRLVFINSNAEITARNIYTTILYVCNFLAVGGLVYIGIKYMMAGAEGKAQLKAKGVPVVLGIVMVYATITFLNLIVGLI